LFLLMTLGPAIALVTMQIRGRGMHHEWHATTPYTTVPDEHRWSLGCSTGVRRGRRDAVRAVSLVCAREAI
jgi:hypothetical protein